MGGSEASTPSPSQPNLAEVTRLSLLELEDRLKHKRGKDLPATGLINVVLAGLKAEEKKAAQPKDTGEVTDVLDLITSSDLSLEKKRELVGGEISRAEMRLKRLLEAQDELV